MSEPFTTETKQSYKVVLVSADNWAGLYINDLLHYENHSIRSRTMGEILVDHQPITSFTEVFADDDWLAEEGGLPESFSEVKTIR